MTIKFEKKYFLSLWPMNWYAIFNLLYDKHSKESDSIYYMRDALY